MQVWQRPKTKNLLRNKVNQAIIQPTHQSGRGAARLARLHGVQEVEGSNPFAPTEQEPLKSGFLFVEASPIEG
jgi:hypothetical protein